MSRLKENLSQGKSLEIREIDVSYDDVMSYALAHGTPLTFNLCAIVAVHKGTYAVGAQWPRTMRL